MEWHKGRTSFTEVINMPHRFFYSIYSRLLQKHLTDDGRKELEGKKMAEALEGFKG